MPFNGMRTARESGLRNGSIRGSNRPARDQSRKSYASRPLPEPDASPWFLMRAIVAREPAHQIARPGPSAATETAESTGFTVVKGQIIEWCWFGPPPDAAPTLVFLHEALGCVAAWRSFPRALADRLGFGAFVYSRAGFGRSGPGVMPLPLDYHQREALECLPELLNQAGIRQAVLVGHSDGGTMALLHAGVMRDPRVRAVVTMAAHVFNEDVTIQGIEAAKREYRDSFRQPLTRYHGNKASAVFCGWSDIWLSPAFRSWTIAPALAGITQPLLAVQGENDRYGTLAQVDAIVEGVSGPAERLIMHACGHVPHLEKKDELVDAVARFVGSLDLA